MSGHSGEERGPEVVFLPDGTPVMLFYVEEAFIPDAKSPGWEELILASQREKIRGWCHEIIAGCRHRYPDRRW